MEQGSRRPVLTKDIQHEHGGNFTDRLLVLLWSWLEPARDDCDQARGEEDDLLEVVAVTDEQRIKEIADALQDIITMSQQVVFKGPLKHGKILPAEFAEAADVIARTALRRAGIRVRKTGRV